MQWNYSNIKIAEGGKRQILNPFPLLPYTFCVVLTG